jgi:hypothetical protein
MQPQLDHLMWAGAELKATCTLFEKRAGVRAEPGGAHPGRGTHNRLVGLGPGCYFEIIAPDPAQSVANTFGEQFLFLATPRIHTIMFRTAELEEVRSICRTAGITTDLVDATRTTSDGSTLRWRLLVPRLNPAEIYVPHFIDWLDTPHPAQTLRTACTLVRLTISQPEPGKAAAIWKRLGIDLTPVPGPFLIAAILATPKGKVAF